MSPIIRGFWWLSLQTKRIPFRMQSISWQASVILLSSILCTKTSEVFHFRICKKSSNHILCVFYPLSSLHKLLNRIDDYSRIFQCLILWDKQLLPEYFALSLRYPHFLAIQTLKL